VESRRPSNGSDALPWAHLRLPPFPQVALQVLKLVDDENLSLRRLSDLISADAAFANEVLIVANSMRYALRFPATSIMQAIAVLGLRTLQGLCVTVGVRAYLGKQMAEPALRNVWRHNLACALIAEQLGSLGTGDKNVAYTAGILHDVGRVALAVVRPKAYAVLLNEYRGPADGILDGERVLFGMDHCDTGRQLVEEWKLPEALAAPVTKHHQPRRSDGEWDTAELIKVSCRLADAVGFPAFTGCEPAPYDELLKELPDRERELFQVDAPTLAAEITKSIQVIERA